MEQEKIIGKIKKCLALAKSDNPHEAAAGMRQAQKLMELHNLSALDISLSGIQECKAKAKTVDMVRWEAALAALVARAFGCTVFSDRDVRWIDLRVRRIHHYVFIGIDPAAQIAQYAYEVLSDQCAKARRRYMSAQSKNCKASTKTARGDRFAEGYVIGLENLIQTFASPEGSKKMIEHYVSKNHPNLGTGKAKDRVTGKNITNNDFYNGREESKNAKLHHGVAGAHSDVRLLV